MGDKDERLNHAMKNMFLCKSYIMLPTGSVVYILLYKQKF